MVAIILCIFAIRNFVNKAINSSDSDPTVTVQQTETVQTPPASTVAKSGSQTEQSAVSDEPDKNDTVTGLSSGDVKVNLSKTWGLQFEPWNRGKAMDLDTGAQLTCDFLGDNPISLKGMTLTVMDTSGSMDNLNSVASGYLAYGATAPYDDAQPEEAASWVKDKISKADKSGKIIEKTFGSADFKLFGTQYVRALQISAKNTN